MTSGVIDIDLPPPDVGERAGGGEPHWVEPTKARHDIDAHLRAGRLWEAGVEVRAVKDRSAPGAWLYGGSNPWAPVTLLVRKFQVDDARVVLAEISFHGASARPHETRRARPDWRTPVVWWAVALSIGAFLTGIALGKSLDTAARCETAAACNQEP